MSGFAGHGSGSGASPSQLSCIDSPKRARSRARARPFGLGLGLVHGLGAHSNRPAPSVGIAELDVDLEALAAVRDVDAPEDVRVYEGAEPHARRDLRARERLAEGAEDLPDCEEGVRAPVGDDAEDVRPEEPDALLQLEGPRLPVDEAILRESAQELRAAERALLVEGRAPRADAVPVEPGCAREPGELAD